MLFSGRERKSYQCALLLDLQLCCTYSRPYRGRHVSVVFGQPNDPQNQDHESTIQLFPAPNSLNTEEILDSRAHFGSSRAYDGVGSNWLRFRGLLFRASGVLTVSGWRIGLGSFGMGRVACAGLGLYIIRAVDACACEVKSGTRVCKRRPADSLCLLVNATVRYKINYRYMQ